jgi:hypothetical protein
MYADALRVTHCHRGRILLIVKLASNMYHEVMEARMLMVWLIWTQCSCMTLRVHFAACMKSDVQEDRSVCGNRPDKGGPCHYVIVLHYRESSYVNTKTKKTLPWGKR